MVPSGARHLAQAIRHHRGAVRGQALCLRHPRQDLTHRLVRRAQRGDSVANHIRSTPVQPEAPGVRDDVRGRIDPITDWYVAERDLAARNASRFTVGASPQSLRADPPRAVPRLWRHADLPRPDICARGGAAVERPASPAKPLVDALERSLTAGERSACQEDGMSPMPGLAPAPARPVRGGCGPTWLGVARTCRGEPAPRRAGSVRSGSPPGSVNHRPPIGRQDRQDVRNFGRGRWAG
jgi:hypothetical protein